MKKEELLRQAPKNLAFNILNFTVQIGVNIWLVPYLINNVGKIAYGYIPIAMAFTQYVNVITISLNTAVSRYLTIGLQKKDWLAANNIYNSALLVTIFFILLQAILLFFVVFFVESILDVPKEFSKSVKLLFTFSFLGYFISLLSGVFNTSVFAHNRLDIKQGINIIRISFRIAVLVSLFLIIKPDIVYMGIANLTSAILAMLLSYYYLKKLTPKLVNNFKYVRKSSIKELASMSSWVIIYQLGFMLFLRFDLFLVNNLLGPEKAGEYAALMQLSYTMRSLTVVISGIFSPMIIISYSQDRFKDVIKFATSGIKLTTVFVGIIVGLLCAYSKPILSIWLGSDFMKYHLMVIAMLAPLALNLGVQPLFPTNTAYRKVKIPGIAMIITGIANVVLGFLFLKVLGFGVWGVVLSSAIVLTLHNFVFLPIYASSYLDLKSPLSIYISIIKGFSIFLLTFGLGFLLQQIAGVSNIIHLLVEFMIVGVIILAIIWFLYLSSREKELIKGKIAKK